MTPRPSGELPELLARISSVELPLHSVVRHDGYYEARVDGDERTLTVWLPAAIDPRTPAALRAVLEHVGGIAFGEPGTSDGIELHAGWNGTLHALGRDAGLREARDGFGYAADLCAPIDVGLSVFYVFHPLTGRLHEFDQDGGLDRAPIEDAIGDFIVRLILGSR